MAPPQWPDIHLQLLGSVMLGVAKSIPQDMSCQIPLEFFENINIAKSVAMLFFCFSFSFFECGKAQYTIKFTILTMVSVAQGH